MKWIHLGEMGIDFSVNLDLVKTIVYNDKAHNIEFFFINKEATDITINDADRYKTTKQNLLERLG